MLFVERTAKNGDVHNTEKPIEPIRSNFMFLYGVENRRIISFKMVGRGLSKRFPENNEIMLRYLERRTIRKKG